MTRFENEHVAKAFELKKDIEKLTKTNPKLNTYLAELTETLYEAVDKAYKAYSITDILKNKMSREEEYKENTTSEFYSLMVVMETISEVTNTLCDINDAIFLANYQNDDTF